MQSTGSWCRHRTALFLAGQGIEVFALDKSQVANDILREKAADKSNLHVKEAELESLPYPGDYFDAVLSTLVLHHGVKADIEAWLKEIKRVLRPEGLLAVSVLSINDRRSKTGSQIEFNTRLYINDTFDPEAAHHFFSEAEIRDLLRDFQILEIREPRSKILSLSKD